MKKLARDEGRAIFFTTHRLVEAAALCDRVAILSRGKIVIEGPPKEIIASVAGQAPLRLDVDDAARAAQILGARLGNDRVHEENDTVQVSKVARDDVPALVALLVGEGIRVFAVASEVPSLEDAYLALHRIGEGARP
jgi:ABC-2 type transport system ATP-binding protein